MNDENSNATPYNNEDLAFMFRRASRMMARTYHRRSHAHHAQEHVLSIIREQGPIKQADLLELLDVRSSSLSEVLGKLQRNGLIERQRNEQDKRSFVISATGGGKMSDSMRPGGGRESAEALFACLDTVERRQLGDILNKIIDSLQHDRLCGNEDETECAYGKKRCERGDWHGRESGGRFFGRGKQENPTGRGIKGRRGGMKRREED